MFRNLTLGKRIASGIVLMLILMAVVGAAGYYGLSRVTHVMGLYKDIQTFQGIVTSFKEQSDQYMLATYRSEKELRNSAREKTLSQLDKGTVEVGRIKAKGSVGEDGRKKLELAEKAINQYRDLFNTYVLFDESREKRAQEIIEINETLVARINEGEMWHEQMVLAAKIMITNVSSYFNRASQENWTKAEEGLGKLEGSMGDWCGRVQSSKQLSQVGEKIKTQCEALRNAFGQYHGEVVKQDQLKASMDTGKERLYGVCAELGAMSEKDLQEQTAISNRIIAGMICAAFLFGLLYAFFSIRKIVGKIDGVIGGVTEGADQVASASEQVAAASQSLAEGSSHQAASIEETSSSLEEISAMVKQNAEHANEATGMMAEVKDIVDQVSKHMGDMTTAIDEITRSSQETDKIVKTIDEIAFQTNLLALNAAVEAARAGEAGAGFAVVADEVRNLAMRAAEAAKNTAELIGDTIKAVKNGSELTQATKESFQGNIEISSKVGLLVDEIAEASREQSEGIGQVSMAVAEMDRITQQNAAGAEESASAAEQMNAQAGGMKVHVDDLIALVHGAKGLKGKSIGAMSAEEEENTTEQAEISVTAKSANHNLPVQKNREGDPNQIIPMDEEDFKDF